MTAAAQVVMPDGKHGNGVPAGGLIVCVIVVEVTDHDVTVVPVAKACHRLYPNTPINLCCFCRSSSVRSSAESSDVSSFEETISTIDLRDTSVSSEEGNSACRVGTKL